MAPASFKAQGLKPAVAISTTDYSLMFRTVASILELKVQPTMAITSRFKPPPPAQPPSQQLMMAVLMLILHLMLMETLL